MFHLWLPAGHIIVLTSVHAPPGRHHPMAYHSSACNCCLHPEDPAAMRLFCCTAAAGDIKTL